MTHRITRCATRLVLKTILHSGCLLSLVVGSARADTTTVELDVLKDTTIYENNPDNGGGGNRGLFVGTNSNQSPRRALISFDLSPIPSNATITSVQMRLMIGQIAGSGGGSGGGYSGPTIGMHRLYFDWGEENTGYTNNVGLAGAGQGNPAQVGDATWNARFFDPTNPTLWAEPGTLHCVDRAAIASASLLLSDHVGDSAEWLSTPALVSDVQRWIDTPGTNFGWILINTNETDAQTFRGFYSKDYDPIPAPPDLESLFPKLIVTYHVPEPSGLFLFAVAMPTFVVLRRFYRGRHRTRRVPVK